MSTLGVVWISLKRVHIYVVPRSTMNTNGETVGRPAVIGQQCCACECVCVMCVENMADSLNKVCSLC